MTDSKIPGLAYVAIVAVVCGLCYFVLPLLKPNSSMDLKSTSMADHIEKVHGFIIAGAEPGTGQDAHMVALGGLNEVTVYLTDRGASILDSNDQQTLGLSGQRKVVMSTQEYDLFLNKLHALLQLKGMAANGAGESPIPAGR